jgi:hypothetical protein
MPEQPTPRWDDPSMWSPYGVPEMEVCELKFLPEADVEGRAAPPKTEEKKPSGKEKKER